MNNMIQLAPQGSVLDGLLYGMRTPSLLVSVSINANNIDQNILRKINQYLADALNVVIAMKEDIVDNIENKILYTFFYWVHQIQSVAGWPIFELGRVITSDKDKKSFLIVVPVVKNGYQLGGSLLDWLTLLFNLVASSRDSQAQLKQIPDLLTHLQPLNPQGANIFNFLKVAHDLNMGVTHIAGCIYQYGYGSCARWLESTFTDETSEIGAMLAKNKFLAAEVMRAAGVPAPVHALVGDLEMALKAAQYIGFPVVVKPVDLDRGVGVSANLSTPDELVVAYNKALKFSKNILVEKHIQGRDYRLVVFRGELIWAIERVPACVVGDGINTIEQLIKAVNISRQGTNLQSIVIDDEMIAFLAKDGLTIHSIIDVDKNIYLCSIANISSGGEPKVVFDVVHEDNKLLAIRAAQALKLDLVGVDFLMPDIKKSWHQVGGAICEVNAQPMLGLATAGHIYPLLLERLVPNGGNIPIILVLGDNAQSYVTKQVKNELSLHGLTVGLVDHSNTLIGDVVISEKITAVYLQSGILIRDQLVQAIVVNIHNNEILKCGLSFASFDTMIVVGDYVPDMLVENNKNQMDDILLALLPMCHGPIIMTNDLGSAINMPSGVLVKKCASVDACVSNAVEILLG